MRVLLIEDDRAVASCIEVLLSRQGFQVIVAGVGADGIALGKLHDYDIILLDLQLPEIAGLGVLETLRAASIHTPVMILSADFAVESKVRALRAGADDYLTKPFDGGELVARVRAIVHRASVHAQSLITTGKITVNLDSKTAEACGTKIKLTIKEYDMLEALSLRKGSTLTKDALLARLYGGEEEPERRIIDVFICKLRRKLSNATDGENYIQTVWGSGYALRNL
jgi:two-component system cell cycle response regulator CtrA